MKKTREKLEEEGRYPPFDIINSLAIFHSISKSNVCQVPAEFLWFPNQAHLTDFVKTGLAEVF
jgi:hypothetical protein